MGVQDNNNSTLEIKLAELDFSIRSRNCFNGVGLYQVRDLVSYSEKDLLRIKNFGKKSLTEVIGVLDSLGLCLEMSVSDIAYFEGKVASPGEFLTADDEKRDVNTLFKAVPWMVPVAAKFLACVMREKNATVAAALGVKGPKGSDIKADDALKSIDFMFFGTIYDEVFESLPENLQIIAKNRTHSKKPLSLQKIGIKFGITRERVRQLEIQVRERFLNRFVKIDVAVQSRVLKAMLGKVAPIKTALFNSEKLISVSRYPDQAFCALLELAGPYKILAKWAVRTDSLERIQNLKSVLSKQSDRIGRIDPLIIGKETAGLFRTEADRERFLAEYLELPQIFGEWVVGDSQRKRVFLSLYKIGKPATKEEIADYAGIDDSSLIGRYLGGNDFICRADKKRWAFAEWVDDPYDGISGEIEQRILEDGGKTTLYRVLNEIPSKFGVAETSVRAYLATPKFVVSDGYVRCASTEEINSTYFGDVEDVTNAVQLKDGRWGALIQVDEQYFDGYSAAIPAPVAWECGLKPGDSLIVPVKGTQHLVSLIWRVNNLLQTIDLGRIAPVLRDIEVKQGDEVVVVPSTKDVQIFRLEESPIMVPKGLDDGAESETSESLMKMLFKK
ncbi:DNA-directed RNA polymerase alpha subunit (EC [Olavius algarvensis associated proteobacterium Delta 3]|nr:DNA-directed RNA polymerase alpha subunit (EC [Olavius algarvensis associated proteobacterium Delta 3]